jgi:type IV pilus assembly protein PilM
MSRLRTSSGAHGVLSWLASSPPDAAIEIASDSVSIAVLGARGSAATVQAYGAAELPPGAVVPAVAGHNIADRAAVLQALRSACERAGHRPRRAALVIPDAAARVSLVRFDSIPSRREDLDHLIRWQVKKSLPFPLEEASITHSPGAQVDSGKEFVVVAARRDVVAEYEGVCDAAGIHAGLVDVATLCVANLYLAGSAPAGDWLIVHIRPEYTSIAIMRGTDLIFFRNQAEHDAEPLSDVVHQTAMYYQDRLAGRGFSRIFTGGRSRVAGAIETAMLDIEARLGTIVEPLDPTAMAPLVDRISVTPRQGAALAPLVGMLLRGRKEVAA